RDRLARDLGCARLLREALHRPAPTTLPLDPNAPPVRAEVIAPTGLPGYEVEAELGRGGMGVVYRARHLALNRTVALKMVLAGGHASEAELVRFLAEAEAVAALQHPGIVQVYEVGRHGGLPYFSLEYRLGGSLARRPAPGP